MFKTVYIICPKSPKPTGGYELLHQLSNKLSEFGVNNYLLYVGTYNGVLFDNAYQKYNVRSTDFIEDSENNLLITPENHIMDLFKYKNINKVVWWLSVDNYNGSNKIKISIIHTIYRKLLDTYIRLFDKKWIHFAQSKYAEQYLLNKRHIQSTNIYFLSDYLNQLYFENLLENETIKKNDIILYNPKKGIEFTRQIINQMPGYNFVPLINMNSSEMLNKLLEGKVYIDFGNHPGKDRIPREAAMCKCCIITNKKGSAFYQEDVTIPIEYKFEEINDNIPNIIIQIKDCLANYSSKINDFKDYRTKITNEEKIFTDCVKSLFVDGKISSK